MFQIIGKVAVYLSRNSDISIYECYVWLRFAKLLDLKTYLIAPPKLLSFFYTFTKWEGVNIVIYSFLKLPVFVTMPLV